MARLRDSLDMHVRRILREQDTPAEIRRVTVSWAEYFDAYRFDVFFQDYEGCGFMVNADELDFPSRWFTSYRRMEITFLELYQQRRLEMIQERQQFARYEAQMLQATPPEDLLLADGLGLQSVQAAEIQRLLADTMRALDAQAQREEGAWQRAQEADNRATQLLKDNLTPEQLEDYEKNRAFTVVGSKSGAKYRIAHGVAMNITHLSKWGNRGLCFYPEGIHWPGDAMLAQKIALETDEPHALSIAHRFVVGL